MGKNSPEKAETPNMQEMTDLVFELGGSALPAGYNFALWREIVRCLPWLENEEFAGIHPLRIASSVDGMLLPRRAKLVLRLPSERIEEAGQLTGQKLHIESSVLNVGACSERPLQAHPTLHAHLVASTGNDEAEFVADVTRQLDEMKIDCSWICGKHHVVKDTDRTIAGYSLVLHDLRLEASLHLQRYGLGGARHYGFGIFVPYKVISGLG